VDKKKIVDEMIKIAIQVNGKVRSEVMVSKDMSEEEVRNIVLKDKSIITWLAGHPIKRFIYVPSRVINIVV